MNPAVQAVLLLLAVYGTLALLLWLLPATWERVRVKQFERESKRCAEDEKQWWLIHRIEQDARRTPPDARQAVR